MSWPSQGAGRPRRRRMAGVACAALAIAAAACDGDGEQSATTTSTVAPTTTTLAPRPSDGVLSIGIFLPQTGPGAALGGPMTSAIEDAIAEINAAGGVFGNRVVYEVVDESAGTGLEGLLESGVDAIVGPASSRVALAELSVAVHAVTGVVTCSPSATAIALDNYPDNKFFFRTVPSDSLQMAAIERRAEDTGVERVAIGFLNDPYGRELTDALVNEIRSRNRLELLEPVGFGADQQDLTSVAEQLLAPGPGVIVVLGDADDGARLLAALDERTDGTTPPEIFINEAIRGGRQAIQSLSPNFLAALSGVAPMSTSPRVGGPRGFFAAHAVDCVNLIALAAIQGGSDAPSEIQKNMASVSDGGRSCEDFADCREQLGQGLRIDYTGYSGDVELSATTGERVSGMFKVFEYDEQGVDFELDGVLELRG